MSDFLQGAALGSQMVQQSANDYFRGLEWRERMAERLEHAKAVRAGELAEAEKLSMLRKNAYFERSKYADEAPKRETEMRIAEVKAQRAEAGLTPEGRDPGAEFDALQEYRRQYLKIVGARTGKPVGEKDVAARLRGSQLLQGDIEQSAAGRVGWLGRRLGLRGQQTPAEEARYESERRFQERLVHGNELPDLGADDDPLGLNR